MKSKICWRGFQYICTDFLGNVQILGRAEAGQQIRLMEADHLSLSSQLDSSFKGMLMRNNTLNT